MSRAASAITSGTVVPVLCASATRGIGIAPLLDLIVKEFPSPLEHGAVEGTEVRTKAGGQRAPDPKAPLSAIVFKTIIDRLTALKKASEQDLLSTDVKLRLIAWLDETDARVRMWTPDVPAFPELAAALAAHYRRARRRMPDRWPTSTPDEVHEFRQRVIVHRYQLDLIEPLRPRLVHKWIGAAQRKQIAVQRQHAFVPFSLRPVELAALECLPIGGIGKCRLYLRQRDAGELAEEFGTPLRHQAGQLRVVIGKEQKRRRGAEFLPHEKQRRPW